MENKENNTAEFPEGIVQLEHLNISDALKRVLLWGGSVPIQMGFGNGILTIVNWKGANPAEAATNEEN